MDETKDTNKETNSDLKTPSNAAGGGDKKLKTRQGSGYLRQLYSTARTTASTSPSNFKSLTTFLVNFIPVDKVDASELQVRTHFDDAEITALAQSIKMHGVLQPVLVVQNGDRYKVIAGERRLRASKLAGMERIPARIITSDDKSVHEIALRENLDRVDLHPLEEGEGYVSLLEAGAYTSHDAIAVAFGKKKSRITECIGYTKLPDGTKEALLQRGVMQRSVLRKLLMSAPEEHPVIIEAAAKAKDNDQDLDLSSVPGLTAAGAAALNSTKPKVVSKEEKPFTYKVTAKAVAVPGFRWKVGEGPARLEAYIGKLEQLLAQLRSR